MGLRINTNIPSQSLGLDPLTAGIISGGMGVAGTLFSNNQQINAAKDQMKFQERMSNTAHQREGAAGYNFSSFNSYITQSVASPVTYNVQIPESSPATR